LQLSFTDVRLTNPRKTNFTWESGKPVNKIIIHKKKKIWLSMLLLLLPLHFDTFLFGHKVLSNIYDVGFIFIFILIIYFKKFGAFFK
jgi:hypothetical protein